ncbi:hypothetical protein EMCRGX_G033413 [Ephydatia muelleri]
MGCKLEKPWLGVYIIQKDLGKGRNCLKTLDGKPLKQTIHCARLKRFLDPVVDDNIVDEVEELDNSDSECAGEQEAANGKNAELDLQQEEYALSKDIDVSLWIDFLSGKRIDLLEHREKELVEHSEKDLVEHPEKGLLPLASTPEF